jgi:serine/threonine protein kinase
MDEPYHPDVVAASVEVRSTGELEELAEPLDDSDDSRTPSLAPGTTLSREGEDPITVLRLLRDGFPLRLYEARQTEGTLWLWERAGASAPLLETEGTVLREVHFAMFPRVQASFSVDGRHYLATEHCPGETFGELLSMGRLDAPRAISILSQVAFALTKLHGGGFIHLPPIDRAGTDPGHGPSGRRRACRPAALQ